MGGSACSSPLCRSWRPGCPHGRGKRCAPRHRLPSRKGSHRRSPPIRPNSWPRVHHRLTALQLCSRRSHRQVPRGRPDCHGTYAHSFSGNAIIASAISPPPPVKPPCRRAALQCARGRRNGCHVHGAGGRRPSNRRDFRAEPARVRSWGHACGALHALCMNAAVCNHPGSGY